MAEKYKQPEWCRCINAVNHSGCWSLILDRHKISREFCSECSLFWNGEGEKIYE